MLRRPTPGPGAVPSTQPGNRMGFVLSSEVVFGSSVCTLSVQALRHLLAVILHSMPEDKIGLWPRDERTRPNKRMVALCRLAFTRKFRIITSARRLKSSTPAKEVKPLQTRQGRILQLLCESPARAFRVSQISGEPRRPLISSIWMQ
jgi:hypothetical protein